MSNRIPVTVLTGFLGSGKTTLLNRILSEEHGLRIAVIENEFGEIGIDQELVINSDEEILEMNNGCICCSVRGDLIRILSELAERKDKFDRVIIETTGMADPGPVAQSFWVDDGVRVKYELDGIVTLVDSKHIVNHLDENTDEVLAQVAFADRIILNKVDLVEDGELNRLKIRLKGVNKMAGFYEATMGEAPIPELLDIGGFNLDRALEMKPNFLEPEYPFEWGGLFNIPDGKFSFKLSNGPDPDMAFLLAEVNEDKDITEEGVMTLAEEIFVEFSKTETLISDGDSFTGTGKCYRMNLENKDRYEFNYETDTAKTLAVFSQHTPEEFDMKLLDERGEEFTPVAQHYFNPEHEHNDEVTSVAIELPGLFDTPKIDAWLNMFIKTEGENIYRMKGVVALKGEENRYTLQGVHMIFGSQEGKPWGDEKPYSRLVFIGKKLNEEYIRGALKQCLL